jgi:integrase/recombinase XerD
VLTPAEAERVLALPNVKTLLGLRDRAILETLYSTGIRRRELSELTVYSVHFGRKTVMVRKGKNKKDRLIPISDRALAWITRYLDEVRPELVVEPDPKHLFLSATGLPLVVEELTTMVGRYVRASGVSETGSCHVFRHTMATAMMENGADIRIIQEILGHELSRHEDLHAPLHREAAPGLPGHASRGRGRSEDRDRRRAGPGSGAARCTAAGARESAGPRADDG